jgi:hypothetical protein
MLRTGGRESDWTDWSRKMTQWRRRLGHGKTKVDNKRTWETDRCIHAGSDYIRHHVLLKHEWPRQKVLSELISCRIWMDMLQTWFFDPVRMKNSQIHWTSTKIYVQWIWQFPVPQVDLSISTASLAQCHLQGPARRQWPRWQKTKKTSHDFGTEN